MRGALLRLHRCAGLALAVFLVFAGLTGSLIAFNDELDAWLNPTLFTTRSSGPDLPVSHLVARVEQQLPGVRVTFVPLEAELGHSAELHVESTDHKVLQFDRVFVDRANATVLGTRQWGECCFSPPHLMPFLYLAHYSLKLPGTWGALLMGIVGIVWFLDSFVALMLTMPRGQPFWRKWKTAWQLHAAGGAARANLDLHRAGGLWIWLVLIMLASSGVAMTLPEQVVRPLVSLFSKLQPSALERAASRYRAQPIPPRLTYDDAIEAARREARRHGWSIEPRYAFHYPEYSAYGIAFARNGESGTAGLGPSFYYFDDQNGELLHQDIMGQGSRGDVYLQAQYQLHTGRIIGLPGRILICLSGLGVAVLSVTGVVIWLNKRASFSRQRRLTQLTSPCPVHRPRR